MKIKKILPIIYAFCVCLFIIGFAQMIFNLTIVFDLDKLNSGRLSGDMYDIVTHRLVYAAIITGVILLFVVWHIVSWVLTKKFSDKKVVSIVLFVIDIAVDVGCFICLCSLMYSCGLLKSDMAAYYKGSDYGATTFGYVSEARGLLVLPIVSGLLFLFAHLAVVIMSFVKRVEGFDAPAQNVDAPVENK